MEEIVPFAGVRSSGGLAPSALHRTRSNSKACPESLPGGRRHALRGGLKRVLSRVDRQWPLSIVVLVGAILMSVDCDHEPMAGVLASWR